MNEYRDIEKSIIKKFRKPIWSKFVRAIKDFKLIEEGDKIAVCISGGKDSMLLAKCLQELHRHGQFKFELEFISMNPGYDNENCGMILDNANILNIPIKSFKTDIFKVVENHGKKTPCYLCARMRRGHLYNKAKELGCNKIALGHHFDDVVETTMLNILYNGRYGTMMPILKSDNFEDMELIRPLYYIKESDVIAWKNYNNLNFIKCGCVVTKKKTDSKRREVKELIKTLKEKNPNADINIFNSACNVNLNMILGYSKNNVEYNFNDFYRDNADKN